MAYDEDFNHSDPQNVMWGPNGMPILVTDWRCPFYILQYVITTSCQNDDTNVGVLAVMVCNN